MTIKELIIQEGFEFSQSNQYSKGLCSKNGGAFIKAYWVDVFPYQDEVLFLKMHSNGIDILSQIKAEGFDNVRFYLDFFNLSKQTSFNL